MNAPPCPTVLLPALLTNPALYTVLNGSAVCNRTQTIVLDAEAGQISHELSCCDIAAHVRVHVTVELRDGNDLPMAAIAGAGGAFDWLHGEPGLYSEADVIGAPKP